MSTDAASDDSTRAHVSKSKRKYKNGSVKSDDNDENTEKKTHSIDPTKQQQHTNINTNITNEKFKTFMEQTRQQTLEQSKQIKVIQMTNHKMTILNRKQSKQISELQNDNIELKNDMKSLKNDNIGLKNEIIELKNQIIMLDKKLNTHQFNTLRLYLIDISRKFYMNYGLSLLEGGVSQKEEILNLLQANDVQATMDDLSHLQTLIKQISICSPTDTKENKENKSNDDGDVDVDLDHDEEDNIEIMDGVDFNNYEEIHKFFSQYKAISGNVMGGFRILNEIKWKLKYKSIEYKTYELNDEKMLKNV